MAKISMKLAEVDARLTEGADEHLQLLDGCLFVLQILRE
jgi:hypothetical protein